MRQIHRALACATLAAGLAIARQTPVAQGRSNSDSAIEKLSKQGEAYRQDNKIDDAIAVYKKGVALKPAWDEGWWYLGTLYYDLDQYSEGRDAFKHLTLIKPQVAAG
jgi:tetratricopeptide (TPR) repeat protein